MQWGPLLPKGGGMIKVNLGDHPPFPLNQNFKHMVLINHDIHPFDGEWNVMPVRKIGPWSNKIKQMWKQNT
jgi:hypothetical protein